MLTRLNKRLSLWDRHLLVEGVKPITYQPNIVLINSPLVQVLTYLLKPEGTLGRYHVKMVTGETFEFCRLAKFENWFQEQFKHLNRDIQRAFEKYNTATPTVRILHDALLNGDYGEKISQHEYTIEVLSPERYEMKPGAKMTIDCPFKLEMSPGVVGIFFPKRRFHENKVEIHAALIHSDFNGRPQLILTNKGTGLWEISKDEAIAQIQFLRSGNIELINGFKDVE